MVREILATVAASADEEPAVGNISAIERRRPILKNTALYIAASVLLLCAGIGLRLANLNNVSTRSPDERTYAWEAGVVAQKGTAGFRVLVDEFRRDASLFVYPPPTRVGYLWLLAKTMAATGVTDPKAGAYLSCVASIGSLLLVGIIAWRFFSPPIALFALLFYSVYPAELALARRAWQDALIELLGLSLIYAACDITRGSRSRAWFAVYALLTAACVTVKETSVLVAALCALWILLLLLVRRDWRNAILFAVCTLAGLGAGISWVARCLGGLHTLVEFTVTTFRVMATIPYNIEYQTGPGYRLLEAFWAVSPFVAVLAIGGLAAALTRKTTNLPDKNSQVAFWISLFFLAFLAVPLALSKLNLRWVSVLFGPCCLLAGMGFCWLFALIKKWMAEFDHRVLGALVVAGLLVAALLDYSTFQTMFVKGGLKDLSVKMILDASGHEPAGEQIATQQSAGDQPTLSLAAAATLAQQQPTAENYLNLSLLYHRAGRYQDCIAAARKALLLKPDYPEAYNNIAAAYQSMGDWDKAIAAAQQALRIRPDFVLARNNLAYSQAQKKLNSR